MNNKYMETSDSPSPADSLAILQQVFPEEGNELLLPLPDLVQLYESCGLHLNLLIREYIRTPRPEHEFAQHIWQTVHDYLHKLNMAYASALHEQDFSAPSAILLQALLQRMDCLALLALCYCLRYQVLTEHYWRQVHSAYQMAEPVAAIAGEAKRSYLQVLMLDSVNRNNMARHKIALLNNWLAQWCGEISLSREYDVTPPPQFFVDLHVPRGAQRLRRRTASTEGRYWHVDSLVARLNVMQQELRQGQLPTAFPANTAAPNALRLIDKLLHEWARGATRRERRRETRLGVTKSAQVVHGILNVCQHVKNMAFAEASSQVGNSTDTNATENSWVIENESKSGFGTFVYADFNRWLEPGCLIAVDYDLNPDLTVVGVVRSIEQRSALKYFVGIEVFSHLPGYARMQQITDSSAAATVQMLSPFSAILLPADDEVRQPATIILPLADYAAGKFYELHAAQLKRIVQLGDMLEQQDDWVRVKIDLLADIL